jgi:beta-lactam-binding protein with PASTA domain
MAGNFKKSFLFHLGIVILVFSVLYILFFTTLHWLTRHWEELKIPDVRGKDMNAAISQLKGMHFEIYVDSTFEPSLKPLTVLKQVPDTGSIVKQGRTVFLTVNMLNPPHIPMPSLVNLSLRSAEMLLHNNKLMLGDTTYKPDIAAGAVVEQLYKGTPIRPGELIAQGSKVSLVIGDGLGNTEFDMPEVINMNVDDAMTVLSQYNLQWVIIPYDELSPIKDTSSATVVGQTPNPGNRVKQGEIIDLFIVQNPQSGDIHSNNNNAVKGVNDDKTGKKK